MSGFPRDSLILPACSALVSAVVLALPGFQLSRSSLHTSSVHLGKTACACTRLRLIGCFVLLGLSITSLVLDLRADNITYARVSLCVTFAYTLFLAALSTTIGSPRASATTSTHLILLLLVTFGVYVYRDLYPLATFAKQPMDLSEGKLLWSTIFVLGVTSVVIPLLTPRTYVPVDPEHPSPKPTAEQIASPLSFALWAFLDPVILLANRVSHLAYEQLPSLADSDQAKNLIKKSFPVLDPFSNAKKRHIFWGLMSVYRYEFMGQSLVMVIEVLANIAGPIGITGLLAYIEKGEEGTAIRPWVWVVWLFLASIVSTMANQFNTYLGMRTLLRTEGIVTQLVFEHALRVRMKADISDTSTDATGDDADVTVVGTPYDASVAESSAGDREGIDLAARKGKRKAQDPDIDGAESQPAPRIKKKESSSHQHHLVGKINNLVTTDLGNINDARDFLFIIVNIPLQVAVCVWFLYRTLGWSSLVGLAVMVICFPMPGYIAKQMQDVEAEKMKQTDARVQTVTESLGVLRMIKLFGWEHRINEKLRRNREEELVWTRKSSILAIINNNLNFCIPIATMVSTFATYTLLMKKELTASSVYGSMAGVFEIAETYRTICQKLLNRLPPAFDILRNQIHMGFQYIPNSIQGKVSLDRINDFLNNTELLDAFSGTTDSNDVPEVEHDHTDDTIGFSDAIFTWSEASDGTVTPSRRNFSLHMEGDVSFQRGALNMVIGPTGSGKTSLLMALLGEMHFIRPSLGSRFNLPRGGGVAYAAQESWVQNDTIKENILFGAPYDEARYQKVLHQCALTRDLELFDAGDETEVGEKGLTLSGGQKARITLARAVYSSAAILLLDDVLAALDVHTSKWIVDNCFTGDLVTGRTIILVTHNVAMISPIAAFVVSLGTDGHVLSQGAVSDVLSKDHSLALASVQEQVLMEKADGEIDRKIGVKSDGKLIVAEEIAEGHVSWAALKSFILGLGGQYPFLFWLGFFGFGFLGASTDAFGPWWLGVWATQYETHEFSEVSVSYYLSVYGLILALDALVFSIGSVIWLYGSLRVSRSIHKELIDSVLATTLRWLDKTPTSRIITRCTQDIRALDGPIAQNFDALLSVSIFTIVKLGLIVLLSPIFILPCILVIPVGIWCGNIYNKTALPVKREMNNARAPVLAHFGAAITGLVSVRAYGAQSSFKAISLRRIDKYTRTARTFHNLGCWIALRVDLLSASFTSGLAAYLVYGGSSTVTAANTGFSLNLAAGFSYLVLWWVKSLNEFEVSSSSLERIREYVVIEHEAPATEGGKPPAYWPASGEIRVENLSARYSLDGPKVLHDISFHVKSGERIGIVGRTGSGKSSLTLALLRCILTEGNVYYDGLPTHSLNLDALRSNITIIPQSPELLSGTLRQNLDPFDQYDDATLNDALRGAGLDSLQSDVTEGKITLESSISSGGGNLSVGQRQILALARAIVRGSKLLILDEATSAIDFKTDSVIQSSLRNELGAEVTLITVAHRLQTIMDADRIMVLDAGRIVEFDSPVKLLQNEKGKLRALVDESKDKDVLMAMAASGARLYVG